MKSIYRVINEIRYVIQLLSDFNFLNNVGEFLTCDDEPEELREFQDFFDTQILEFIQKFAQYF